MGSIALVLMLRYSAASAQTDDSHGIDPTGISTSSGGDNPYPDPDPDPDPDEDDSDGDGVNDAIDAVPDDSEINWPRSPEAHYLWMPQVTKTGATAVSKHGHILFPNSRRTSTDILWDSMTSGYVNLIMNNSWSGSGLLKEIRKNVTKPDGRVGVEYDYQPATVDAPYNRICSMNDAGSLVGESDFIETYVSALMKWEMTGSTNQYGKPTYHLPSNTYYDWHDKSEDVDRKRMSRKLITSTWGQTPKIADDGTISYMAAEEQTLAAVWIAGNAQPDQHSNQMSV
jgi:hypothetical protein